MNKKLPIFALMAFGFANSQNIFRDDFSTYISNQVLSGQGLWTNNSTAPNVGLGTCLSPGAGAVCTNAKILDQSMSFFNYGSSTKALEIAPIKDSVARPISPAINSGDFYVSFVLNLLSAPATSPVDFIRVNNGANPGGFPSDVCFRMLVQQDGFGYKIGIRKGATSNTTVFTSNSYNIGDNTLIILKYSHLPSTNDDLLNLYVNPDFAAGEPTTSTATTSSGSDQAGFIDRLAFRQLFNTVASFPTGFASLVSVARTWADLGFNPLATNQFENNNISVFANNATNGTLNINSNVAMNNVKLNIYTITGALIEKQNISLNANSNQIKINQLNQNSLYIAELIDENGNKYTKKITLN